MQARRALLWGTVFATSAAGCQLLIGVDDEVGSSRDAGAPDTAAPAEDPCPKAHVPAKVPGDGGGPRNVFAATHFSIRPSNELARGYDLDRRCTGTPTAILGPSCIAPTETPSDDDGGVDNAFGQFIDEVAPLFAIGTGGKDDAIAVLLNNNLDKGNFGQLFFLYDYNGEADDDSVSVGAVGSAKLISTDCFADAGTATRETGDLGPNRKGCDLWSFLPGSNIVNEGQPLTQKGYVVNHQLVVRWDGGVLALSFGSSSLLLLGEAILTAQIEPWVLPTRDENDAAIMDDAAVVVADDEFRPRWRLTNGTIAGRANASSLVAAAGNVLANKVPLCNTPAVSDALKGICKKLDLPFDPTKDGRGLPCDAISFALGFEAEPARLGKGYIGSPSACTAASGSCGEK